MEAKPGDRIIIGGHAVGEPDRDAEVLEVRGKAGGPPYIVRWSDSGHETLFFPGPDASVQHLGDGEGRPLPTIGGAMRSEHQHLWSFTEQLLATADGLESDQIPDALHEVYEVLVHDVLPHAGAEETELYPAVSTLLGAPAATAPMSRQHVEIQRLVDRLGCLRQEAMPTLSAETRTQLRQVLYGLHAILSLHLATEEELYLPLLDSRLSPARNAQLVAAMSGAEHPPSKELVTP